MPAVVRVKRHVDEEPLSAFVLNGKRRRLNEENAAAISNKEELSTVLKFAGTIKEQDNSATTQFARLTKEEAKELVLKRTHKFANTTDRIRQQTRQNQHEQRFRVVNCLRTTLEDCGNEMSKEITIVDIEKHTANDKCAETLKSSPIASSSADLIEASTSSAAAAAAALTMPSDSDTGYVYDLYIPDNEQHAEYVDLIDDNYLSVRAFDDLICEDHYNNDDNEEYDSEDSNQENYVGNEYPDEDIDKDDMENEYEDDVSRDLRHGLKKFVLDDDEEHDVEGYDDSSSDDDGFHNAYRDPYVHSIDPEEEDFCDDVDSCDVDRYGKAYARYKARIMKTSKDNKTDDDLDGELHKSGTDEDDDEYYQSANESE